MNRTLPLVFVSALILAGAFYFSFNTTAPPPAPSSAAQEKSQASVDVSALMDRVEKLEAEVARLKAARRPRGPRSGTIRPTARMPKVADDREPGSTAPPNTTGEFAEAVAQEDSAVRREMTQIVRDEFANMRGEWREMRRARHEARDGERLEKFAESADLDDEQVNQMSDLLAQERERVGELFRAARETYDFRGAREKVRELKGETDRTMGDVLDEKQLELWKEDRAQRQRRRPW